MTVAGVEPLRLERDGGLARITLTNAGAGNPLGSALTSALREAATACDDAGVRAVLIVADGASFSVGGDLREMVADPEVGRMIRANVTDFHAAVSALVRMDAPVVAAVQGMAAGAGMALALAADIVLAAQSACFTMAYTRVGLSPDGAATFFLPRLVGLRKALELTLLNPVLAADDAERVGIVTRVLPDADLRAEAERLAARLAEGPTRALGRAATLLHGSFSQTLETQMELEARALVANAESVDGRAGREAFVVKATPSYVGR